MISVTISADVEHPTAPRYAPESNLYWCSATEGDRVAYFVAFGEMLEDAPMLEHLGHQALERKGPSIAEAVHAEPQPL